ncbi:insulinase family protein [Sphingomonas donggukensis]|uniref:Insulinase family protein n=1 Tax=Sphingomonas donggukensis TaxID=2949093 RepID=A0ABY4TPQ4_9SPHN|nr:M16 family metallopeptidase [Sphingomonas donggukensis]URW74378.1 insulinase family protein [Sphingomonas donggukensis]
MPLNSLARRLSALALMACAAAGVARNQTPTPPVAAPAVAPSWLHAGSDIPADPEWRTGTLPNGVRYAVRRNATPPNTVAIRVRIDAGALMEGDAESGWAHFLEHMVFRGTTRRPDGEAVRLWQRLGASFGSDTNAFTSMRATVYKLDLPRNDAASLDEATGALADMMTDATIAPKLVDIERKVVLAERAARITPSAQKVQDAVRPLFQSGLLAERRDVGGTAASLAATDSAGLRRFYKRWYRPERAVVVVAGDADPAVLEGLVRRHFGGWQGDGPRPSEPAYGAPTIPATNTRIVVDPLVPAGLAVAWIAPHDDAVVTAERERADTLATIALRILNQRLDAEARTGGDMLGASVSRSQSRNLADQTTLSVSPRPDRLLPALVQAYRVVNRTLATPVDQAEIDQQTAGVGQALRRAADTSTTWSSATQADLFVGAVDSGDVAGPRAYYADLFAAQVPAITPAAVQSVLRTLFAPEPRLLVIARAPVPAGDAAKALTDARKAGGGAASALRTVTIDALSPPRAAGAIAGERRINDLGIERVTFANGVELDIKHTDYARDSIGIDVRIGHGLAGRRPGDAGLGWSSGVLAASGIAGFTAPELARFAAGRQVGFGVSPGTGALSLSGTTSRRDLDEALRVMLAGVLRPSIDPVALSQAKDGFKAVFATIRNRPGSVLQLVAAPALYGGDLRFRGLPAPGDVYGATVLGLRRYWTEQMAAGPVRIAIVGDVDRDAAIAAVARTFGALPPRTDVPPAAASLAISAMAAGPIRATHAGDPDQAAVMLAWRTGGALADLKTARALLVAQALIQNRLTEEFRETEGGSYSPSVSGSAAPGFEDFGAVVASAQLRPERIADFAAAVTRIVADIAARGPDADALARARQTVVAAAERNRAGNAYWRAALGGDLDDPRQVESIRSYVEGRRVVDAAAVQAVVRRYLTAAPLRIEVVPASRATRTKTDAAP